MKRIGTRHVRYIYINQERTKVLGFSYNNTKMVFDNFKLQSLVIWKSWYSENETNLPYAILVHFSFFPLDQFHPHSGSLMDQINLYFHKFLGPFNEFFPFGPTFRRFLLSSQNHTKILFAHQSLFYKFLH